MHYSAAGQRPPGCPKNIFPPEADASSLRANLILGGGHVHLLLPSYSLQESFVFSLVTTEEAEGILSYPQRASGCTCRIPSCDD
jgi:hypothetical protein